MNTMLTRAVVWALAGALAAGGCGRRQAAPDKTGGAGAPPAAAPATTLPAPVDEAALVTQLREDVDRVLGGMPSCAVMAEASASLNNALDMAAGKMKQPANRAAVDQMKTRVADAAKACR
jgi:hypothetical protein